MAILEVCCGDVRSVLAAHRAGAQRVELCSALSVGGLTPSVGMMRAACRCAELTKHALIRPREGDFCYSETEVAVMLDDIAVAKTEGMDGVVVGALLPDGRIDVAATERMVAAARPMSVTFHRAFDRSHDLPENLEVLIRLGIDRVLTSGGAPSAMEGVELLGQLVERAAGRIVVLPGAGVNVDNGVQLLRATGATELHGSLSTVQPSGMQFLRNAVQFSQNGVLSAQNAALCDATQVSSEEKIKMLLECLKAAGL